MSINAVQFMSLTCTASATKSLGSGQGYEAQATATNLMTFGPNTVSAQIALTTLQLSDDELDVSQIIAQITKYRVGDTWTNVGANSMKPVANVLQVEFTVQVLGFSEKEGAGIEATAICTAFIES